MWRDICRFWNFVHIQYVNLDIDDPNNNLRKINLQLLRERGFQRIMTPKPKYTKAARYYSWLRFKEFSSNIGLDIVLKDADLFMEILNQVHEYYKKNNTCVIAEGLKVGKGPSTFNEKTNESRLFYYG